MSCIFIFLDGIFVCLTVGVMLFRHTQNAFLMVAKLLTQTLVTV